MFMSGKGGMNIALSSNKTTPTKTDPVLLRVGGWFPKEAEARQTQVDGGKPRVEVEAWNVITGFPGDPSGCSAAHVARGAHYTLPVVSLEIAYQLSDHENGCGHESVAGEAKCKDKIKPTLASNVSLASNPASFVYRISPSRNISTG
ncbi:hypothetical protein WN51_10390 [Melipona quadrifasciata]|uniref:Uncharacterized protein n=1 Tax=Melipona quadrifasciata TaxID=166423 RepID=A0A0M9A5P9_9HYME|nr:hypothetical protein WN51_10390 [Melipona quadrifasciata]